MTNKNKDVSSITVREIFLSLRPAQLWAILLIVVGLISGTFILGYKANSFVAKSQISKYESEIATLKDKGKQFRGLQTKQRFIELYLKYLIAVDDYKKSPSEEHEKDKALIAENFRNYIFELLKRGEEARDEIDLTGLFLGKGSGREAFVKFGYDGSLWILPEEFGFHAKK